MKKCIVCLKTKELTDFRLYLRTAHSFYSKKCKRCLADEKKAWVKANFTKDNERNKQYNKENANRIRGMKLVTNYWPNLSWQEALVEWDKMFKSQNGCCAVCTNTSKILHVDHCHTTSKVRGLLCYNCNNGIGRLKDSVDILKRAIEYIKDSK